jgi:anti-sigma regulatory factor (Ser/Thr protein kinase)
MPMMPPNSWWEDVPDKGMRLTYSDAQDLAGLRRAAANYAESAGMDSERVPWVLLAVSELASNTLRHSGGPGTLRLWSDRDNLFVQVSDGGELPAGVATGQSPFPSKGAQGGYGLALAGRFSDEILVHPAPTVVRLRLRLI